MPFAAAPVKYTHIHTHKARARGHSALYQIKIYINVYMEINFCRKMYVHICRSTCIFSNVNVNKFLFLDAGGSEQDACVYLLSRKANIRKQTLIIKTASGHHTLKLLIILIKIFCLWIAVWYKYYTHHHHHYIPIENYINYLVLNVMMSSMKWEHNNNNLISLF